MKRYFTLCFLLALALACGKKATDYRSFLGGHEITYPGVIQNPAVDPGNGRLLLIWHPSTDPSVARYVVYWNNYADSTTVPAVSHNPLDTVKCYISNLSEYTYTFFVNSYDSAGNKSVTSEIDNARVYGPIYQASLYNRPPDPSTPFTWNGDGSVTLNFGTPDTINIITNVSYTNAAGVASSSSIALGSTSVTIPSYKPGSPVLYQSSFIPVQGAIDTFWTLKADTFPPISCEKSLFAEIDEPTDMHPYQSSTNVAVLWNGSVGPQGYPNIFHSDGASPLPGTITFDMGRVYNGLDMIEETGRNCCHNPTDFEVWGIADTTGAFPTLASNDPGWKAQNISLGWTLLVEGFRTDDGQAPMRFNFISNPPPVRFIRFRVIKTEDDPNYCNMSQLTFWDKE